MREHPGLARPGAGHDEQRAARCTTASSWSGLSRPVDDGRADVARVPSSVNSSEERAVTAIVIRGGWHTSVPRRRGETAGTLEGVGFRRVCGRRGRHLGLAAAPSARRRHGRRRQAAGWHILVYMVNDSTSDLPYGFDLDEMVAASRSGIDFTVYLDSSDATDFASDYVANTGQAPHRRDQRRCGRDRAPPRRGRQRHPRHARLVHRHRAAASPDGALGARRVGPRQRLAGHRLRRERHGRGGTSAPSYLDAAELGHGHGRRAGRSRPEISSTC